MKNLCILAVFCATPFVQALDKSNLEKAIRGFDIEAVRQIVATEKLTPMEFGRYISLADEIISERKFWVWRSGVEGGGIHLNDLTTPYKGPYLPDALLEVWGGCVGAFSSGFLLGCSIDSPESFPTWTKRFLFAGIIAGVTLIVKGFVDAGKSGQAEREYRKLLRKKYDDAVSIRQLLCTATIKEA